MGLPRRPREPERGKSRPSQEQTMYYRDLFAYYLAKGGDTSRETSFGDRNWDDVVDPEMQTRLEVVFNHDTGDVRAVRPDRTIILVGNITARWGHEESIRWFREPNRGDWPPRPLSRFRGRSSRPSTGAATSRNASGRCPRPTKGISA